MSKNFILTSCHSVYSNWTAVSLLKNSDAINSFSPFRKIYFEGKFRFTENMLLEIVFPLLL